MRRRNQTRNMPRGSMNTAGCFFSLQNNKQYNWIIFGTIITLGYKFCKFKYIEAHKSC